MSHDQVIRNVNPEDGCIDSIRTPALDALVERVKAEQPDALERIHRGEDQVRELWPFFVEELSWEDGLPVLEELYELQEALGYISLADALEPKAMFRNAEGPSDYIRLLLLHVVVTRITQPDADAEDPRGHLRLVPTK